MTTHSLRRPSLQPGRPNRRGLISQGKPASAHEQALIGSLLLVGRDSEHGKRWLKKVSGFDFGEPLHSWLWGQLKLGPLTAETVRDCRTKFRVPLFRVVAKCLDEALWWHGDYYAEEVIEAAIRRNK